jgi:hypothetical protein
LVLTTSFELTKNICPDVAWRVSSLPRSAASDPKRTVDGALCPSAQHTATLAVMAQPV